MSDPTAAPSPAPDYAVVVPTLGRPSLAVLLRSLAAAGRPRPSWLIVVDDRGYSPGVQTGPQREPVLDVRQVPDDLAEHVLVLSSGGRGPAAARNTGWRHVPRQVPWVVFVDDDVVLPADWCRRLAQDLTAADAAGVAASQAELDVPLPAGRPPTDWERSTAGLSGAWWITADMAYRRDALEAVQGFDERFPRAFREDADLALRVQATGRRLVQGARRSTHPVRPAGPWASLRQQRGNADDVLMSRVHGRTWADRAGASTGRRPRHLAITAAAALVAAAGLTGRRRWAAAGAALWAAGTAEFAAARIVPGPRDRREVATMLATSVAIPPAAVWWWGLARLRRLPRRPPPPTEPAVAALLLDRDGTLVQDVPYNGDPEQVRPLPGVGRALARARAAGLKLAVVSNQSGLARGAFSTEQLAAVQQRVESELGAMDTWAVCPHGPQDGCSCRKPAPGLVLQAAATVGVPPERCLMVGDIGSDVQAAQAAGARAVLVPTEATLDVELAQSPAVCRDLATAVELALAAGR